MIKTFKEINDEEGVKKKVVKHGMVLGINFSKEEEKKFKLEYGDEVLLDNASIIKNNKV
jgi:hypothetical protein